MPFQDGTGPFRSGRGCGRQAGRQGQFNFFVSRSSTGLKFLGVFTPLAGAIFRDIFNPNGLIRSLGSGLLASRKCHQEKNRVVDAKYTVLDKKKIN